MTLYNLSQVLAAYIVLVLAGVPVWWKTTGRAISAAVAFPRSLALRCSSHRLLVLLPVLLVLTIFSSFAFAPALPLLLLLLLLLLTHVNAHCIHRGLQGGAAARLPQAAKLRACSSLQASLLLLLRRHAPTLGPARDDGSLAAQGVRARLGVGSSELEEKNVGDELQRSCHLRVSIVLDVVDLDEQGDMRWRWLCSSHRSCSSSSWQARCGKRGVRNSSEFSFFILAHAKERPGADELVMSSSGLFGWISLPLLHETSSLLEDHLPKISRSVVQVVAGGTGSTGSKNVSMLQQQQQHRSARRSLRTHARVLDRRVRVVISLLVGHVGEEGGESRRKGRGGGGLVKWEIDSANEKFLLPFTRKLQHVYDISVESQVFVVFVSTFPLCSSSFCPFFVSFLLPSSALLSSLTPPPPPRLIQVAGFIFRVSSCSPQVQLCPRSLRVKLRLAE
eukprot:574908-Hanusia_phi.AAC.1